MPEWVFHSTYRGIDIYVWMPLENFYTAYFLGDWQQKDTLFELQTAIDAYLGEPPLTVYLQPPLDGARLEFRYRSYGLDEFLYPQLSVDGMTFWPQGGLTVYDLFELRFPAQTGNGIPYLEASTGTFMYQSVPQEITLNLEEAVVVDGRLHIFYYWIEGMAGWEFLETYPTPAKVGDEIHLGVGWINDGSAAAVGHVSAQLTSPALYPSLPNAVVNQDRSAEPGTGWVVQFAPVTLNESGSWEFFGMLALDGEQFIDTKTINFAVEAPPPDVKITTLNYPAEARAGEDIEISWLVKNEGGDGVPKWFRIRDLDTDGLVPPGEMGFSLAPGAISGATIWPTMPNRNWRLRAETGYDSTLTDSRDFTIAIEPEDVVVYVYDLTNETYLNEGSATLDGVTKTPQAIFNNIEVGSHTVSINVPGYDFDLWDSMAGGSWVEILIDNPNSPSTGITTQSGGPGFLRAYVTESLPSSATITVSGKATGGYPTPSMRLYVYDNGVLRGYKDFSISIGAWYTFEKVITGAGIHRVYGRMRLSNALGSFYFLTETVEFELG